MAQITPVDPFEDDAVLSNDSEPEIWESSHRGYYDLTPPAEYASDSSDVVERQSLETSKILVAVIGVGYVGQYLIDIFSTRFSVIGYDISISRVKALSDQYWDNDRIRITNRASELSLATHFLVSVPTLLLPDQTIDSSYLRSALTLVVTHAQESSTVVIESSVAVGMTRELLGPVAQQRGLFAGMSPERVDPGRIEPPARAIPKVVSGLDDIVPGSLDAITALYCEVFDQVVPVTKPEVAEMMKLYENCQRMVCIAYANEMADSCLSLGIDPFEISRVAATKPFGYLPFTPSVGVGGHCIPVNPYYLLSNCDLPLLRRATETMRERPAVLASRAVQALASASPSRPWRPRVLVVGLGFKAGQSHLANSPGLELAKSLALTGEVEVAWIDPLVNADVVPQLERFDEEGWNVKALQGRFESIIVAVKQQGLDFDILRNLRGVLIENWCQWTGKRECAGSSARAGALHWDHRT